MQSVVTKMHCMLLLLLLQSILERIHIFSKYEKISGVTEGHGDAA